MSKKKTKKKEDLRRKINGPNLLMAESVVLGLLIIALASQHRFFNQRLSVASAAVVQSSQIRNTQTSLPQVSPKTTPAALPRATPQAAAEVIVPPNFGRSVNVPILMYHYIGNNPNPADTARDTLSTAPDIFDQQMGIIASRGFTPITLDTLYAALKGGLLPAKPIVLTFDDGYVDFYVNAFPILKKYNFHAVAFIPTSLMSQGYYMSWSQIKEIQSSGLIAFEAHSLTHPTLTALSPNEEKAQIVESKKALESEVGTPVNFFAYPFGISNSLSWKDVQDAGYFGGVGTWYGTNENEGNVYNMPRVRISGGLSLTDFAAKL